MTINDQCETLKRDCLTRIRDLRMTLDHIEKMVLNDDGILNDLGELQLQPGLLDCRLASLATVRSLAKE